jgi:hypothetical protein
MPAVPILMILAGYWIMVAGVKRVTLADAWNGTYVVGQTPVSEGPAPGSITRRPLAPGARPPMTIQGLFGLPPPQLGPNPINGIVKRIRGFFP